ncbi:MAG: 16S rRNA methyltransferase, partial [Thermoplasmata archaeon]
PTMSKRRGRPDIIYILLEVTQESILNRRNMLRTYIHTRNDFIITVNPLTRVPKSYNRFIGLFEDLFRKGTIGTMDKTLLSLHKGKLSDAVSEVGSDRVILLSPRGETKRISDFINEEDTTVIIGGFSEGDFLSDTKKFREQYSIFNDELTIWSVGFEMIASYERMIGLV